MARPLRRSDRPTALAARSGFALPRLRPSRSAVAVSWPVGGGAALRVRPWRMRAPGPRSYASSAAALKAA